MTEVIIMAPVTLAPSPDLSSPDISQQSEIKKFVHTTIDSMEYFALSKHFRQFFALQTNSDEEFTGWA